MIESRKSAKTEKQRLAKEQKDNIALTCRLRESKFVIFAVFRWCQKDNSSHIVFPVFTICFRYTYDGGRNFWNITEKIGRGKQATRMSPGRVRVQE